MADYTGNSIVDYLSSTGQDSSYAARAKMAAERGINNYSGTAAQNTQMLGGLRDSTTPTMPATAPVGGDFADKLTPDMKKQMVDMAEKHNLPTATEAEQWKIAQAALSPEQLTALGVDINDLVGSREAMEEQKQIYDETDAPSTTGLGVLQSALTAKTDEFNREATTPDMMAAAGITGYGALQSSMAAKQKELNTRITGLQDRLLEQGDKEADVFNAALDKYKILRDDYNIEADRMSKTVQDIMDHEQAIDLYEQQARIDEQYKELENKSGGFGDNYSSSYGGGDWDVPGVEALSQGFVPHDASSYREAGRWECGEAYNDFTNGKKVGDEWSSKLNATTHKNNPSVGNGLAIPWGGTVNGHMGTVLSFDKDTGTVYTVEFNHDGNGKQTFQQYTIDKLNSEYGDNWGFTDSTLKSQYQSYANDIGDTGTPDWFNDYVDEYAAGEFTVAEIKTKIGQQPGFSTDEKNYYKTLFDTKIEVEPKSKISETVESMGTEIEDLPYPLNVVLEGFATSESPKQKVERSKIQSFISSIKNMKGLADSLTSTEEAAMKKEIKSKVLAKAELELTEYQLELIYKAVVALKDSKEDSGTSVETLPSVKKKLGL